MSVEDKIEELRRKKEEIELGGGEERIEKQHSKNKLTARERIDLLLDSGSFVEVGKFVEHRCNQLGMEDKEIPADGVVTGYGNIDGRKVFVFAQDFTVMGGSLGEMHGKKICNIMDMAIKAGAPIIGINDSGGARIQEGVDSLASYGEIFYRNTLASGKVPQISVVLGPTAGGAVYSPAITDFVFMTEGTSVMFITGPRVVKTVTGEEIDALDLGGAKVHAQESGVAQFVADDDESCLGMVKELVSYLPSNCSELPPKVDNKESSESSVEGIVPADPRKPYDVREVITGVVDNGEFFEVSPEYAPNLVTGYARLNGNSVGIVANQAKELAGVLDIKSSEKGARFVRFCDAFNIPLVTFVDLPGYMPGKDQEYGGIIKRGAKLLYAYSEATVPKVTIILRKAYGGGYIAMCSKHLKADQVFAWPTAEIAVMGPEGAAGIIYRKEIKKAEDPQSLKQEKIDEYRDRFANPYFAASRGYIDDVIEPQETRGKLIKALDVLISERKGDTSQKKHGNIPL